MKQPDPALEGAQIVLRGDFNPAILHPSWFEQRALIGQEEARDADLSIVSRELTSFNVGWFSLRVTQDYFGAESTDPSRYLSLRDLVVGVFSYLEFTPLRQLGINRRMHFKVANEDRWHELGDRWAPKDPWADHLIGNRDHKLPGVRSLTMEGNRKNGDATFVRVTVAPSVTVNPGIYVDTNEHYESAEEEAGQRLLDHLTSAWSDAQAFALAIARHLLKEDTP